MLPHTDGEILNDEVVIIHSSVLAGKLEVFEPYTRVFSLVYLAMLVGGRKHCGNDAF